MTVNYKADAERQHRCFNEGCDARLRGDPIQTCPYSGQGVAAAYLWRQGWLHVAKEWAILARRHWHVRPLPPVKEVTRAK